MRALAFALRLSALALWVLWVLVCWHEREKARRLPPGMLSLYHRERATGAVRSALVAATLAAATLVGVVLT